MNNAEKFRKLFIEFEEETKKKDKKYSNNKDFNDISKIVEDLYYKRINPYYTNKSFLDFCRRCRNLLSHNNNDSYLIFTDELLEKFIDILEEVKHPYDVYSKSTKNIYSRSIIDNVVETMNDMIKYNYTHIPIYDGDQLIGIFSESAIYNYILKNEIVEISSTTIFKNIIDCINLENSYEIIEFVKRDLLYDDVVNNFIKKYKNNEKLNCIMITQNGKKSEKIIGIITAWDIIGR